MSNYHRLYVFGLIAGGVAVASIAGEGEGHKPSLVRLVKAEGGYQLLRDGKPYFIKGAGGDGSPASCWRRPAATPSAPGGPTTSGRSSTRRTSSA